MRSFRFPSLIFSLGLLLGFLSNTGRATTIAYQATQLPGVNLWQYDYYVSGSTFAANEDFTIFFNYLKYSTLQNEEPAASSDWNVLLLQPDANLPADGAFDSLALVNDPSTVVVFQVTFVWTGSGAPGSQPFTIDQLAANGNVLGILETGNTVPYTSSTMPEPATWLLCLGGLGALGLRVGRRKAGTLRRIVPALLFLLTLGVGARPLSAQFNVVGINQVSSTRVTRTQWDYSYTVTVQNTGASATGVTGTVTSSAAATVVVNGNFTIGDIGAGQTVTSTDTFTIEQDRTVPFDPKALTYKFQPIPVNQPPVANAGPDQVAMIGQTVQLDGSMSHAFGSATIVAYAWTYVGSVPAGISVAITGAGTVKPTVYIPAGGTFTFGLVVTDSNGLTSAQAPTHVRTGPVAVPGPDQTVGVGQTVQLNGGASFDPSGYPLTYSWTLSVPSGSAAKLSNASIVSPTFVADVVGVYTVTLTVNNGVMSGEAASAKITAMNGQLYCGDIVSGSIKTAAQVDQYTYAAQAGGLVTLTLGDTSGFNSFYGVVAKAIVYDPTGKVVLTFQANSQQQFSFAMTGNYIIQVESNDLVTSGTYNLGVVCRNPLQPAIALSCGGIASGNIKASAQVDQYTYAAQAGGVATLTLGDTGGFNSFYGVVANATILDPNGKVVLAFQANSQQQFTFAITGTYLIQVESNDLVTGGTYNLGVVCRNPLQPAIALSCGGIASGNIKASAQVDQYTYAAQAGGMATLTLADTGGFNSFYGVVANATIFDPNGKVVLTFQANSQQQFTFAITGTYLIQVESNDLVTGGTYNLGVVCRNPLLINRLSCGGIVSGNIKASAQVDQYTYAAQAGGVATLTLGDTGGFNSFYGVVAKATVYDPTGKVVLTFQANSQQQFTFAITGTYLIQVDSNDLVTGGTYNLGVVCRNPLQPAIALSCGGIASGTIKASAQVDQYTYAAQAGSSVTLTLGDTSGFNAFYGVVAYATLFDPNGTFVLNFQANSQHQVKLALNGTYLIQAESSDLVTGGTYNLGLACP